MTELEQIDAAWQQASQRHESAVLATVVRVQGSTYRRAGARLLLTSGGSRVGSVSGGCLEADLVKKGWWLTQGGKSAIRKYDTSIEGEITGGFGLGCNGIIHILLERLENSTLSPLIAVPVVRQHRRPAVIASVINESGSQLKVGQRWIRFPDGTVQTDVTNPEAVEFIAGAADEALRSHAQVVPWQTGSHLVELFVEMVLPRFRLLIFGAGDDAIPMARLAGFMGYETIVLDGRSHLARSERIPDADRVLVNSLDDPLTGIAVDDRTAAILMSHSYAQDLATLRALAPFRLPYLGLLGPRKRTERMIAEAGLTTLPNGGEIHSPVGLDIGADGAEQIALAAIAEIQSAINQRAGGRLREKAGPLKVCSADEIEAQGDYAAPLACPMG
jgi:xanthine/CO dehydrogenase XdhC/CoxF family maturation factor